MIPKRVTLKNFLSFGDNEQTFDFTDEEALWILTGPNGVGKSAIFDAITYCLFEKHRASGWQEKNLAKHLIRHGEIAFRVSFEFEFAGVDYRIARSRTRTSAQPTQRVESRPSGSDEWKAIPGINSVDEVNDWVTDTLGLAYEAFTKSVLLRQGESDAIILAKGTERLEMLKRIIDVERFERLSERISTAMKDHGAVLRQVRLQRENATEVSDAEVQAAKAALDAAEVERTAAQAAVQDAAKSVEQAKQYALRDEERRDLDAKLHEADERAKQRDEIERLHARFTALNSVVPSLKKLAGARGRIAVAEADHGTKSTAQAKLKEDLGAGAAALDTARQKFTAHQSAQSEHDREANRLTGEVQREEKFLETAQEAARLAQTLGKFPDDLDARLQTARDAARTADDSFTAATAARADADSQLKQAKAQQKEFATVGATCSKCRQPVTKEHAADERAKLDRAVAEYTERLAVADQMLGAADKAKQAARREAESRAEDVQTRDTARASHTARKQALDNIGLGSDPEQLKQQLEAKRTAASENEANAASEAKSAKSASDEVKRLEATARKQTADRDTLTDELRKLDKALAGDQSERDTLLAHLAPEWHASLTDRELESLAAEQASLSSIGERFAALQRDSRSQIEWNARRETVLKELAGLPATPVREAETAHAAAIASARDAGAKRDAAQNELVRLQAAVEEFRSLVESIAAAEVVYDRHRKLNAWLGKEGLLRELVREAERDIVHYAQETLRNLSGGDLEVSLAEPSDGKDEALVLVVRRSGDPDPTPVRFLSGSQKFRVAVAIAVAIGKFAAGPAAARPLESVIIDEGFGSLDKDGLQAMREELENLKNSQALKRVILVSHQEEFTDTFPVGYRLAPDENGTIATRFRHDA